ncbi:ABC transporter permease [Siculibacillus lacustris]|uniref:ABC transporter permease n=1 Tax=Siculibacillus lacustris TaxID=1549641 RepID=A0A4Q9VLK8_9HYPH|nr:ABC transporter permease [Siculibacillus lacustris]TBW36281.1 ABC transporter permease [Siculibacillus lacustris]
MRDLILGRLVQLVATLLGAATVVFVVTEVLPGDPAAMILGVSATPETLAALHRDLGLDRPVVWRFLGWLGDLARGELGESTTYRVAVASLIGERLGVTLALAVAAIGLSTAIGLPVGLAAAARAGGAFDTGVMVVVEIGLAVPAFWIGILLVLGFSVTLGWLPAGGFPGWGGGLGPAAAALVLPVVALALPQAAILARVTRGAALEVLSSDFVRAARAKGLDRGAVMRRHVARNALVPVVTILGLQFSSLVAGAILIENVFNLPGLGRLLFQAISGHDLVVVRALVTLFAGLVVVVNSVVDVAYGVIDPRLGRGAA